MSFSGSKDNIKNTFLKTLLTAGFSFAIFTTTDIVRQAKQRLALHHQTM